MDDEIIIWMTLLNTASRVFARVVCWLLEKKFHFGKRVVSGEVMADGNEGDDEDGGGDGEDQDAEDGAERGGA